MAAPRNFNVVDDAPTFSELVMTSEERWEQLELAFNAWADLFEEEDADQTEV